MRLFEILLILTNLLGYLFAKRRGRLRVVIVTLIILLIAHWVIEGNRWQMIPVYWVTLAQIVFGLIEIGWRKGARRVGKTIGILSLLVSLAASFAFPLIDLPRLNGEHVVSTVVYHLTDDSRPEHHTDTPDDVRELMVQIWYPAELDVEQPEPRANYIDNLDIVGPAMMQQYGLPGFLLSHAELIDVRAHQKAAIASEDGPYPVLLFVHGWGGIRGQNTRLVEELASQGYIVVAADHPYANLTTVFPDGRTTNHKPEIIAWDTVAEAPTAQALVAIWTQDLQFILEQLTLFNQTPDHRLEGNLNLDQLGVLGHSTGGGTAYEFCYRDSRCGAALGLDPWVVPTSDATIETGITQPMLAMRTLRGLGELNLGRLQSFYDLLPANAYMLTVDGTAHNDYTDFAFLSPLMRYTGLTGTIEPEQAASIMETYTIAFFDHHLRGWGGAVLYGESAEFPEVTLERK